MKKFFLTMSMALSLILFCLGTSIHAATFSLFEYGFNIDSTFTPNATPGGVDGSGFNFTTGLGTLTATFNTVGSHNALLFVDHDIDEPINGFSNETGSVTSAPGAGQTWEIDEPGFNPPFGDIFFNAEDNTLDNSIGDTNPNDVAMAMGFDFVLLANEIATVNWVLGTTDPGGFFLRHTDPDSGAPNTIYFSSNLVIEPGPGPDLIPAPSTMLLFGTGLVGLATWRWKTRKQT